MNSYFRNSISATLIALLLAACGGGGGSASTPSSTGTSTPPAPVAAPTVSITADQKNVALGSTVTVNWTGQNTSKCNASGAWSGQLAGAGSQTITPSSLGTNTYTVTCDTATAAVSVNVLPQETAIPDPVFAAALNAMGYPVVNGKMQTSVALSITKMIISTEPYDTSSPANPLFYKYPFYQTPDGVYITDATGLENFANLTDFRFEGQQVKSFDLHAMTQLTKVSLWKEPINQIDLSNNKLLTNLGLSETQLSTVDISMLPELVEIDFQQDARALPYTTKNGVVVTGFTSLDVSKNKKLLRAYVYNNGLKAFDVSNNSALQELWASGNKLQSLDLRPNKDLNMVIVENNDLTYLNITGIANNGVPSRLYTTGNPNLLQIQVTSVSAIQKHIADIIKNTPPGQQPATGYFIDPQTVYVGGL